MQLIDFHSTHSGHIFWLCDDIYGFFNICPLISMKGVEAVALVLRVSTNAVDLCGYSWGSLCNYLYHRAKRRIQWSFTEIKSKIGKFFRHLLLWSF